MHRFFVVSDVHLGGKSGCMMSRPDQFAAFIASLPQRVHASDSLELVIAGDFIDFLAIEPYAPWTPQPAVALDKLNSIIKREPWACVFDALQQHVAKGHRLTILVGNHDLELALPAIQDALVSRVGSARFIDDGRAYRRGQLLIEHGNRYDPPNENDWGTLRAICSAQSRFEEPHHELEISNGSRLVHNVLNRFKVDYPFLDLLQPQNEILLYLLLALEPSLRTEVRSLVQVWKAKRLSDSATGTAPPSVRKVGSRGDVRKVGSRGDELATVFPELHAALRDQGTRKVGARNWLATLAAPTESGLAAVLRRGERPSPAQLANLRVVARKALLADTTAFVGSVDDPYATAAGHILDRSTGTVQTVIMGHTHLAREVGSAIDPTLLPNEWRERIERAINRGDHETALYINTGTWADRIRFDVDQTDNDDDLVKFLQELVEDVRPPLVAHYADVSIAADGRVCSARLGEDRE